jgi:hypothetical protein
MWRERTMEKEKKKRRRQLRALTPEVKEER